MDSKTEILLNNLLTNNFQKMFKPLNIFQSLLFLNKYHVKYNFITPNSNKYYIGTFITNVLVLTVFVIAAKITNFGVGFYGVIYLITYFQYVLALIVISILNNLQSKANVTLMLKLQELDKYSESKGFSCTTKYTRVNCILLAMLVVNYIFFVAFKMYLDKNWTWARATVISLTSVSDLEIVYCASIINFIATSTKFWLESVKLLQEVNVSDNGNKDLEKITNEVYRVFEFVIDAFNLTKKLFRVSILLHVVVTFFQSLVYLQILIFWIKSDEKRSNLNNFTSHSVGIAVWVIKGVILVTYLCVAFDRFDAAIMHTRAQFVSLIKKDKDKTIRRLAKNVIRLSFSNYSKMCACGVFMVDASLPLKLGGLVATYCVVLLQFAFL